MDQNLTTFSKEAVKARMMQHAASLWGLKNPQLLDPFVKLLIEAFSTEIFKVNNEVNNIKTRMLEKIARLLTPAIYTIPQPAHAIAFAQPVDTTNILYSNHEFFCKRQFPSLQKTVADIQLDIAFTPVDHVKLSKAKIEAMFTGRSCSIMDERNNKIPLTKIAGEGLPYGTIWLAIDIDAAAEEQLNELCLYFSCPDFEHLEWLYTLMPYASYFINRQLLTVQQGIQFYSDKNETGYRQIFNEYTAYRKIQDTVKSIYANQFITLSGLPTPIGTSKGPVPDELTAFNANPAVEKLVKKEYTWLQIQLPPQYSFDVTENFSFILNAFPVINRKWKQNECKFDVAGNNIPLVTSIGEHFLSVEEVVDGAGRKYEEIPYSDVASLQKGLFSIRVAGMERFDERNAIDMIHYVLELTRDEVAAFGNIDRDNVVSALKEMVSQMKFLERKTRQANGTTKQIPSYVMVEPHRENEYMYASYWVTHCTLANNLRPGLILTSPKNAMVQKGALTLLTNTIGGEEQQRGMDAVQAYRFALTTRDRIITVEDIKNFCRMELRGQAKEIHVKKGTAISQKPKEGFIRTLEITIIPQDYELYTEAYWNGRAKVLVQQIEQRAVDGAAYRVFIKKEQQPTG